jgi:serine/threonine protein kinase
MEPIQLPELRIIAVGSFGRVYAVQLAGGETVAIKTTKAVGESEYHTLWFLGHVQVPHTVSAIAALRNAGPPLLPEPCELAIAMTHVRGTTLREHLTARAILGQSVDMALVRQWSGQLVDFLLHAQVKLGLSHDDLKLGNIMVERERDLRVVDFTFAGYKRPDEWHCGTLCYMPPERLFYLTRPLYATRAGPDMWAVGTLMTTMVLTAQPIAGFLTAREAFHVTDDQGRFDPSRTNTVYDLLSDREPWFANASESLSQSCGLGLDLVRQGIRLVLWCRARVAEGQRGQFRIPQADDLAMPGFTATPLCRVLTENMGAICGAYDASGSRVYECVWQHMRQRMGEDLYSLWRSTQHWSPRMRGTLEELQQKLGLYPAVVAGPVGHLPPANPPKIHDRMDTFVAALYEGM